MQLSQKERMLLEDLKSHEEICIQKYSNYANQAQDPQLKQLFQNLSGKEQEHLNTINQILQGQVPTIQQDPQKQQQQLQQLQQQKAAFAASGVSNPNDAYLCTDLLSTEKYVSSAYNTAIFEFVDPQVRQVLNHIQGEEQVHGEELFNYMYSKGMYKVH